MPRVMVAMSGGVDSSVAAARLLEQGHQVAGVTMQLPDLSGTRAGETPSGEVETAHRAQRVCHKLGISHRVLDLTAVFYRSVVEPFVAAYAAGRTPNPCLMCNGVVKWGELLSYAEAQDCEYLATGHYAQVEEGGGRWLLKRGVDRSKDQSYVLYGLSQETLARTLLPLGSLSKDEVRQWAMQLDLPAAKVPESQDICFLSQGDLQAFLRERVPFAPGLVVDRQGRVLGEHEGLAAYTVGQRRGLGIGGGEPLFVIAKDTDENRLVVGPRTALARRVVLLEDVNWLSRRPPAVGETVEAEVEVRYRGQPVAGTVTALEGARAQLELAAHEQAVAPGQAAVFYQRDLLLGGGIITEEGADPYLSHD